MASVSFVPPRVGAAMQAAMLLLSFLSLSEPRDAHRVPPPPPPPLGQLGPGRGPWRVGRADAHGLSAAKLASAAAEIAAIAPTRDCLLVVKGGEIVHESYPRGQVMRAAKYETDSLGKIFTAGVIGAAVQAGYVDIDRPLAQAGRSGSFLPSAAWNRTGVDFWPRVTPRHLLTQMGGYGLAEPGTLFSCESTPSPTFLAALCCLTCLHADIDYR